MHRLLLTTTLLFILSSAPAAQGALILDIDLDELELDGSVSTSLLGPEQTIRWTRAGTDDCFLTVNADSLLLMGLELQDGSGKRLFGEVLIRAGLQVQDAVGTTVFADAWSMLRHFDENGDGQVDGRDPVWNVLNLFMDMDADGKMEGDTLHRPETALRSMDVSGGDPYLDGSGNSRSDGVFVDVGGSVGVMSEVDLFLLVTAVPPVDNRSNVLQLAAAPNPFNPRLTVEFELAEPAEVRVGVYDVTGRLVRPLFTGMFGQGTHRTLWSGKNAAGVAVGSGIYFVRLESSREVITRKVSLVK